MGVCGGNAFPQTWPEPDSMTAPVIDAHTHFFPESLHQDPASWAALNSEPHWSQLVAPNGKPSLQGWASEQTMLQDMDTAGVEKAVLAGWYWEQAETCRWHNEVYASLLEKHPDRFMALASCQPTAGPESVIKDLEFARKAGFSGVGELLPQLQGFDYEDEGFRACLDFCREHGWPILLHVTEPVGRPHSGRIDTPLQPLVDFLGCHSDISFILAHWGGLLPFFELNSVVSSKLAHVYYDTAASPLLYDSAVFALVDKTIGPNRVLYGSDYPLRIFPGKSPQPEFLNFLKQIQGSGLDESTLTAILGGNAAKLFGSK